MKREDILAGGVYIFLCLTIFITSMSYINWDNIELGIHIIELKLNGMESCLWNILSIIVSGVISFVISFLYYYRGNRNGLKMTIILPLVNLLGKAYNRENYIKIYELSKEYNARYLKSDERRLLNNLICSYEKISLYVGEDVNAKILLEYFNEKHDFMQYFPVKDSCGNIVDYVLELPTINFDLHLDLKKKLRGYDTWLKMDYNDFDGEDKYRFESLIDELKEEIICGFNRYCNDYSESEKVVYFEDEDLLEVLKKSKIRKDWDKRFSELETCKKNFLDLKIVRNVMADNSKTP